MDDGEHRELIDKGPEGYFAKLLLDQGAREPGTRKGHHYICRERRRRCSGAPCGYQGGGCRLTYDDVIDDDAAQEPCRKDVLDGQAQEKFVHEPDEGMWRDLVIGTLGNYY